MDSQKNQGVFEKRFKKTFYVWPLKNILMSRKTWVCLALAVLILLTQLVSIKVDSIDRLLQCYDSNLHKIDSFNEQEIQQVVFAKVHKTASSTLQNILFRFAMARKLSLLLPARYGPILSEWSSTINRDEIVSHPKDEDKFDILGVHVLYEAKQIDTYFHQTAFRVAILREPMKQTLSALAYYTVVWPFYPELTSGVSKHPDDPINGYLKHPEDFAGGNKCPELGSMVANRMSYDLGVGMQFGSLEALRENSTLMTSFLQSVEKQFDLVLISEYFDESVVLLRRRLKWSMRDIIYLRVNTRKEKSDPVWKNQPNLTSSERIAFRYCNKLDYKLYQHFLPIFLDKIDKERLFKAEVSEFKAIQKKVKTFCEDVKAQNTLYIPQSAWTEGFTLEKCECSLMGTDEIKLVEAAKRNQMRLREEFRNRRKLGIPPPAPFTTSPSTS